MIEVPDNRKPFVTIHEPLTPSTNAIIKSAVFINIYKFCCHDNAFANKLTCHYYAWEVGRGMKPRVVIEIETADE